MNFFADFLEITVFLHKYASMLYINIYELIFLIKYFIDFQQK